jgi:hypothetical protein
MEKDPRKLNPVEPFIKTYPGQELNNGVVPTTVDLLPEIFRTDTNKKVLGAIVEDLFQPSSLETLNFYVGYKATTEILPHPIARRQLEPGLLTYNTNGVSTLSADELAQAWDFNNRQKEKPVPISILDLPIDPDKFINWTNYYWIDVGMPLVYITSGATQTIDVVNDIVGKQYYTTPVQRNGKSLELKNGMRIVFQPDGRQANILGDVSKSYTSTGRVVDPIEFELSPGDSSRFTVSVGSQVKTQGVDYFISGNELNWLNVPTVGSVINYTITDYYVTTDNDLLPRRWQVEGVGTEGGIKLLGKTHQYTSTVYSRFTDGLWDQTAVPWDRVEWDGSIDGINAKHYILQKAGAENRNAHSRVNVWYHADTIQATVNFLGLEFSEIANFNNKAKRPIVEFDNKLELYNHGVNYRSWPTLLVNSATVSINDFIGLPLVDNNTVTLNAQYMSLLTKLDCPVDIAVQTEIQGELKFALNASLANVVELNNILASIDKDIAAGRKPKFSVYKVDGNQVIWIRNAPTNTNWVITYRISKVLLSALRILWLTNDENCNAILNIKINSTSTIGYTKEIAKDGDTIVVNVPLTNDPHYVNEYYWKDGVATRATYRKSLTQQPLFELYSRDGIRLSEYSDATGYKPSVINSTLIEIVTGNIFDRESGYKLKFLPSQFDQLTEGNIARYSMFDVMYNHTQHKYAYYIDSDSNQKTVSGPLSFRRFENKELYEELSNGYRRAWFRLKSWALRHYHVADAGSVIELDASMWPTYEWTVSIQNGNAVVLHSDDFANVVDNRAVIARGEIVKFNISVPGATEIVFNGESYTIENGEVEILIPNDATDFVTFEVLDYYFKARVIDVNMDPRFIKVKLDDLPTTYTPIVSLTNGHVTSFSIQIDNTGILTVEHQGNVIIDDSITAMPGLTLNSIQNIDMGEFTPSRFVYGMLDAINATKKPDQSWIDCPQVLTANGIQMADNSVIRSAWANFKLKPSLSEIVVSRSLSAWRWHRKFIAKLEEHVNLLDLGVRTPKVAVDRLLEELLLGVTYSSPDAVSGMAFSTNSMSNAMYTGNSVATSFVLPQTLNLGVYGPDHVYVYVNDILLQRELNYTLNTVTSSVEFNIAPLNNAKIEIYHSAEIGAYSAIPASPAKLGLTGLFQPGFKTETWGDNSRTFIQRHDGSRLTAFSNPDGTDEDYYVNKIILELEQRIFNGCTNAVGQENRQGLITNYNALPVLDSLANAQIAWFATNNLNYRDRTDFIPTDPWTWNYNGSSWRGLYIKLFGTFEIHSAPWEALGFDSAPAWWATHYSWTNTTKRLALEYALTNGIITEPGTAITVVPSLARKVDSFPVGANGKLLDPFNWGMYVPSADEAQQPWDVGSFSPAEMVWRRSVAGTWAGVLHAIDDYSISSKFFDSTINPFITTSNPKNSTVAKGSNSMAPNQFFQDRPSIGIGAAIFEAYREFNLVGEDPLYELMAIDTRLQFSIGGFTDGDISLQMPFTKYQTGNYVPTEDILVTKTNGVPITALRYSAIRVEQDDVGFRVYGFDPTLRSFTIFKPTARSTTSSFPSSRKTVSTPYGDFIEYTEWDTTAVNVPYGSYIENKQALITFMMGLGEYQKSKGLLLDTLDEQGVVTDWKKAALDALAWSAERWDNSHYCIVGIVSSEASIKFKHEYGMLERLDNTPGQTGKVLFHSGRSALADELLVTRDVEKHTDMVVSLKDEQIVFVDFKLRNFDHCVYVNRKTKFGDLIYDPQTGNKLNSMKFFGRRTYNWTGRPSAPGTIIQNYGMLPGFDTLTADILESHKPELSTFDSFKTKLARTNVIPAKDSVIFDIIQDPTTAYLYRQGLQSASGTNLSINALFRNNNIDMPGRLHTVEVGEQWMFNAGDFGRLDTRQVWEIELRKSDITNNRQIIRFNETSSEGLYDLRGDNIIDLIGKADKRWITRPAQVGFTLINELDLNNEYSFANSWLPSAGIANLADTSLQVLTAGDLKFDDLKELNNSVSITDNNIISTKTLFETRSFSMYSDYDPGDYTWNASTLYRAVKHITGSATSVFSSTDWQAVAITGRILPSIWVSDYDNQGWNVLQTLMPAYVEEACPNALAPGLNESKISFASPHGLQVGDKFIMAGSGDGNFDNLHTVKNVVDSYNILIEARSTSDKVVYNLVVFKLVSVKFNSEAEWQSSGITWAVGMKAYIDYGDTEGSWKIINYIPDGDDVGTSPDIVETYNGPMVDSANIYRVAVIDYDNESTVATIEVFDPYKGLTIDEVTQYIDYRQIVDPAVYNLTEIGELDRDAVDSWAYDKLGKLWWDISQVRYIEYEQSDDIQYRAAHWGEKFADSTVAIYEWVYSEEVPTIDTAPMAKKDTSSGAEQIRYSEEIYIDPQTNARSTRYYYWNKSSVLPAGSTRPYTASSIESVLNDPDANGVAWLSPIGRNALLISNFTSFFGNNEKIVLRIEQNKTPEQTHTTNILVAEGFTGDIINDFLFNRLTASVEGRDNYRETHAIKQYVPNTAYLKGEFVAVFTNGQVRKSADYGVTDYPILQNLDDTRFDIISSWESDSGKDHNIYYVVRNFTSTTFDEDKVRRKIIKGAVDALIQDLFVSEPGKFYAVINKRRQVPSRNLHPLRRYGNSYIPEPQSWYNNIVEARRTLVAAANNFLLNIDTVSKPNWDKYLTVYKPLSGKYTRDLTKYWKYVDYVSDDYVLAEETTKLKSLAEASSLDSTITNFAIIDDYNNITEAYFKDGNNITLAYRKNGTIQFLDAVWDGSLGDGWDNGRFDIHPWDEDASEIAGSILRALRYNIFTGEQTGYFNLLFFAMVKESLNQLKSSDWVTKTTYLEITQESIRDQSFIKNSRFYNKREGNIQEYINEVKPFHSKIVDTKQFSKTSINVGVEFTESVKLTTTTLILTVTEDDAILTTENGKVMPIEYADDIVTLDLTEI